MKHEDSNQNKRIKGIIMVLTPLLAIYLGVSVYFMNHFYFGSSINSISVMGKTVEEVNETIKSDVEKYSLEIEGRENSKDKIDGLDINLSYSPQGKIEELKKKQNPFLWIVSLFNKNESVVNDIVTFDEELLKKKVSELSFKKQNNIIEPENPKLQYGKNGYEVIEEVKGTKIDDELLYKNIRDAIMQGKTNINIDEINCYQNPNYNKDSQEVTDAKNLLDKYTSNAITYDFEDRKETVDGEQISKWLSVDDDMNVQFDKSKVRLYVESLARKYNTVSATRQFKTSSGNTINIGGGNYGWALDKPKETEELINAIKEGKTTGRKPVYEQTAISRSKNDIGNTYVEVDLSKQHLWLYKNGNLVTEGDVVSGNTSLNWGTDPGVFRITFKARNYTLKGENYASDVTYWMPFNGNVGLHDASWRPASDFGGTTYLTNGSHGCVNLPVSLAQKIFENIEEADPVICY